MPNQTISAVNDQDAVSFPTWRTLEFPGSNVVTLQNTDFLNEVPVMSATVLGLDMLMQERSIDLQRASELILNDVGATLRILRLTGREYDVASERLRRMSECLASLDVSVWFSAISARTFVDDWEHAATTAVWKHCRLIARYAQLVAESLDDVSPDDAYLVGLLHEIGGIPAVLGWPSGGRDQDALLEVEEMLPLFVVDALQSSDDPTSSSVWRFILSAAHKLAAPRTDCETSSRWSRNAVAVGAR